MATSIDFINYRYLNLSHREDRDTQISANLEALGFAPFGHRFEALHDRGSPLLGCVRSHLAALTELLVSSEAEYLMVLEDDWRFELSLEDLESVLRNLELVAPNFGVFQISATDSLASGIGTFRFGTESVGVMRLHRATSAASYIVRRDSAPELINVFAQAVLSVEKIRDISREVNERYYAAEGNRVYRNVRDKLVITQGAADVAWAPLQMQGKFVSVSKKLGFVEPSTSDITPKKVDNRQIQLVHELIESSKPNIEA